MPDTADIKEIEDQHHILLDNQGSSSALMVYGAFWKEKAPIIINKILTQAEIIQVLKAKLELATRQMTHSEPEPEEEAAPHKGKKAKK